MQIQKHNDAFNLAFLFLTLRLITSNQNQMIEINELSTQLMPCAFNAKTICRATKRAMVITTSLHHTQLHKYVFVKEPKTSPAPCTKPWL